ncbi:MAG: DUF2961 domain-containing protein [Planctomycetota bacterium]|jgi:hypothetical protein
MSALFARELDLPTKARSERVTKRPTLEPGRTACLLHETGRGCLLHWWITFTRKSPGDARDPAHDLHLKIFYDGQEDAAVDMPLAAFFATLMDIDACRIESAAIKVLPARAFNCYLPMCFEEIRLEIANNSNRDIAIWFMANMHKYSDGAELTPLRLKAVRRAERPAQAYGSFLMADLTGRGFIAGMVMAVEVRDETDAWFHSGGELILLDGESSPSAIRGIGGEDCFTMSHGVWQTLSEWAAAPHIRSAAQGSAKARGYQGLMYRFFGPDPIWFETSAVVRFGSRANDLESVVYAYVEPAEVPRPLTPERWLLAGPFECRSGEEFERKEWAEEDVESWPSTHTADFGQYLIGDQATEFEIPATAAVEHGWCDLARHFRGRHGANVGTQPTAVCGYAAARVQIDEPGKYTIAFGYDDMAKLWLDGELIHSANHAGGFCVEKIACDLPRREAQFRVKLSNEDNEQWRLWAFSFRLERA